MTFLEQTLLTALDDLEQRYQERERVLERHLQDLRGEVASLTRHIDALNREVRTYAGQATALAAQVQVLRQALRIG
jgi:hypothetical protein